MNNGNKYIFKITVNSLPFDVYEAVVNTLEIYGIRIIGYDELGRPITNNPFGDMLRNKEMEWHDDDWCEEPD